MTFVSATILLVRPLVFAIAALPMVVDNLRTGRITNRNNAIIFLAGLGMLALWPVLSATDFHLPAPSLWMLVGVIPVAFFALGWIGGGGAKFLIALLPWFSAGEYLSVAAVGLILAGGVAKALRRENAQIAPPMVMMGLIVQAAGIAATAQH
jgi:Flp pilus assembly protein protease CpaA